MQTIIQINIKTMPTADLLRELNAEAQHVTEAIDQLSAKCEKEAKELA